MRILLILAFLGTGAVAALEDGKRSGAGRLEGTDLAGFEALEPGRKRFLELGLATGRRFDLDRYVFGSAHPGEGGFDCSGAVYYLMKESGLVKEPPRSSAAQFDWVKKGGGLVEVPGDVESLEDAVFDGLKPGDLLFWSGTYQATDGRTNRITHVQIYLGREKADGRHVMLGSSDGRSYRGTARCGYGVFDFRLPGKGSKARLVGYGAVPGIEKGG